VKVVGMLASLGLVSSVRGRAGGFRLSREPADINVGWVVRSTEPDFHLVECFDRERDTCPITPACGLKHVLGEAQGAFLATLDRYTLADFLAKPGRRERLVQLWKAASGAELAVRR
jgi:Rrf2 family nitric oxide-sensitive transcriptional repressor